MAIKAADQITITDITDAYSVILTSEAYTFLGDTSGAITGQSCTTQAVAYCGATQCTSVSVDQTKITKPSGITAEVTSGNGGPAVTITISVNSKITEACEVIIPVVVDGITVNKKFSIAIAKTGANGQNGKDGTNGTNGKDGAPGKDGANGEDALTVSVTTSNGTVFKNNSGSTELTAHVYKGGVEQTISDAGVVANNLGTIKWYKGTTLTATAKKITVNASQVDNVQAYTCQLEG